MKIRVEHLRRARPGEARCGDVAVHREDNGLTLFAIVDALGHGEEAAAAADRAREHLESTPLTKDLPALLDGLHGALRAGRGAAATLCLFDGEHLSCVGVGNVELRSRTSKVGVGISGGIVGRQYRPPRPYQTRATPGERVVLFSDGLSARLTVQDIQGLPPKDACLHLLETWARATDDAAVLVADFEEHG